MYTYDFIINNKTDYYDAATKVIVATQLQIKYIMLPYASKQQNNTAVEN